MKIVSPSIHQNLKSHTVTSKGFIPAMVASMGDIVALTFAGLVAIAVITLSVWAAGIEINPYLGLSTWGLGFIFLGLAVDNHGRIALFQLVTGAAFLVLALLQNSVSPGFIIVSGVLLAIWLAAVIFKRLSV